eukprot:GILK01009026.1.p1 GENE.GILK01009026.1~~GILK01009026.1.p1  ORF type:complete len:269 (-),score=35.70 GILK01009026.1:184-990(-)
MEGNQTLNKPMISQDSAASSYDMSSISKETNTSKYLGNDLSDKPVYSVRVQSATQPPSSGINGMESRPYRTFVSSTTPADTTFFSSSLFRPAKMGINFVMRVINLLLIVLLWSCGAAAFFVMFGASAYILSMFVIVLTTLWFMTEINLRSWNRHVVQLAPFLFSKWGRAPFILCIGVLALGLGDFGWGLGWTVFVFAFINFGVFVFSERQGDAYVSAPPRAMTADDIEAQREMRERAASQRLQTMHTIDLDKPSAEMVNGTPARAAMP